MNLSRRQRLPRFGKGTTVKDRVEILLQARTVPYDPKKLKVVRWGCGNVYGVVVADRIIGEYDHLHHKLHLFEAPG